MSNASVRVVAQFAVLPDKVEEFIRAARETLVAPTLGEPGCLEYQLCQDKSDPTRFAMIESWQSEADLQAHLAQKSLQAALAKLMPMASQPPQVQLFRPVS